MTTEAMKVPETNPSNRAPLPPLLFCITVLAGWLLGLVVPLSLPLTFEGQLACGSAVLLIAFVIGALALREMIRSKTPVEPNSTPRSLVTTGPFCISRNPLYVALVSTTLGIALLLASVWIMLGCIVLAAVLNRFVVPVEEKVLSARFPEDFAAYCRSVRRWL